MANMRSTSALVDPPVVEPRRIRGVPANHETEQVVTGGERVRCPGPGVGARRAVRPVHRAVPSGPARPAGELRHAEARSVQRRPLPRYRHGPDLRRHRMRRTLGVLAAAGVLGLLAAPIWGHPTAVGVGSAAATATAAPTVYVVQQGDTLRSIAQGVDGGRNVSAVVAELRAQLDGAPLVPGTRLVLP